MTNWTKKSFGDKLNAVNVMAVGLRDQLERISKRGLDEEFVNKLETLMNETAAIDSEQENLKSSLKKKTAELEAHVSEIGRMMDEAKKVVKLEFEPELWKKFGIADKR